MKTLLKKLLKALAVLAFLVLIIGIAALGYFYFEQKRELDKINNLYSEAQSLLNQNKEESQLTIENLQNSFKELNKQVSTLKEENENLTKELNKFKSLGTINGRIIAFVSATEDNSLSQFQMICAERVENRNQKYCITASALVGEYSLLLPNGKYYITSTLLLNDGKHSNIVAKYTNYVKCINENKNNQQIDKCNTVDSNLAEVTIESGSVVNNINPIDIK
jgi:cell shape-determining protein MreC